ncbi:hypothetical protein DPEC_G00222950 [Dallia pectoralis]|uniref:Uncharacterized protein n=1 Tax=Dallia pectoralis TaxID=75939 RepID=A0ACC2FZY1_DALPE|nr:hypothetical protein DPEC_G00222950 [Dallia pectoralis]
MDQLLMHLSAEPLTCLQKTDIHITLTKLPAPGRCCDPSNWESATEFKTSEERTGGRQRGVVVVVMCEGRRERSSYPPLPAGLENVLAVTQGLLLNNSSWAHNGLRSALPALDPGPQCNVGDQATVRLARSLVRDRGVNRDGNNAPPQHLSTSA